MVELAINLNKKHRGVKGIVSKLTTYIGRTFKRLEDIFYRRGNTGRNTIKFSMLFDRGADGGAITKELTDCQKLESLTERTLSVQTAIGVNRQVYKRAKLKVSAKRYDLEMVHNMGAIELPDSKSVVI